MAKTMDKGFLIRDDFFEIPGDPCIYSVDMVEAGVLIATNCQTSQMVAFPPSMREVDFLYR